MLRDAILLYDCKCSLDNCLCPALLCSSYNVPVLTFELIFKENVFEILDMFSLFLLYHIIDLYLQLFTFNRVVIKTVDNYFILVHINM